VKSLHSLQPESSLASSDLLGWASIHPFLRLETVSPSSWVKVLKFLHCDSNQISCWGGLTLEKKLGGRRPTLPLSLFVEIGGSDSAIMNRIPPAQACYFRLAPSSRRWPSTCVYSACHRSSHCFRLLVLRFAYMGPGYASWHLSSWAFFWGDDDPVT